MMFSIIIPVYNQEKLIGRALESVIAQMHLNWEAIVVDDGSTDTTEAIVEEFCRKDTRIRYFRLFPNSGLPAVTRNAGLKMAKAEAIAFLDSDDFFYPEKLKVVKSIFDQHSDVNLVSHGLVFKDNGRIVEKRLCGPHKTFEDMLFQGNPFVTSSVVMRKTLVEKTGLFNEAYNFKGVEDYDYWLRSAAHAKIFYSKEILGEYTITHSGVSSRIAEHYDNTINLLEEHFSCLDRNSSKIQTLMKSRRALAFRTAAREFYSCDSMNEAEVYLKKAIQENPRVWKQWGLMALINFRKIFGFKLIPSV